MQPIIQDQISGVTYRTWGVDDPHAVVILIHGLCSHSPRWEFMAQDFVRAQINSYAIDLQGFGATEGSRGHINSFSSYYSDIINLINIARKEFPDKKIFLCGQSMGALIVFIMASIMPPLVDGILCLSPAFKNIIPFKKTVIIKAILAMLYNRRKLIDIPFTASMCTRDTDYQGILDHDELAPRKASAQLLVNILSQQKAARNVASIITIPILLQVAGSDSMVDSKVTKRIYYDLTVEDKKYIEYPEHVHALSYDEGRERVFEDAIAWILTHL